MLNSGGGSPRKGLTATSLTGGRPLLIDIVRRIPVPLMGRAAHRAGPDTITQGDGMVEGTAHMTAFGRGKEAVDVMDVRPMFRCGLVQDLHKASKAQISHFPAPHGRHATECQVFKIDRVVLLAQRAGGRPMPSRALMGNPPMPLCQRVSGLTPMARAREGARQRPIGFPYLAQAVPEGEGCPDIMPVVAREKLRQPKVKRCGVTRLASDTGFILTETREHDCHPPCWQTLDRHGLDRADDLSGLVEPIETAKERHTIAALVLPSGLRQRDRLVPYTFPEGRRTAVLFAKELLIALVDAPDNMLHGLCIQRAPVGKPVPVLQPGDVALQAVVPEVAMEAKVVPLLDRNQMIVDLCCQINPGMQMTHPLRAVELKDKGTPRHLDVLLRLNVVFDDCQRDRTDRRDEFGARPQRRQSLFQPGKFCPQHVCGIAFDLTNDFGNPDLRMHV